MSTAPLFDGPRNSAALSLDGVYRYNLTRQWDGSVEPLVFVMLNPSTADADTDDPTIRRCIGFARREGAGGIRVVNLYAFRATKPHDLWLSDDPIGPRNDEWLTRAFESGHPVVAAWGANAHRERVEQVLRLPGADRLTRLGVTKAGAPRHPLYVRGDQPRIPWPTAPTTDQEATR